MAGRFWSKAGWAKASRPFWSCRPTRRPEFSGGQNSFTDNLNQLRLRFESRQRKHVAGIFPQFSRSAEINPVASNFTEWFQPNENRHDLVSCALAARNDHAVSCPVLV